MLESLSELLISDGSTEEDQEMLMSLLSNLAYCKTNKPKMVNSPNVLPFSLMILVKSEASLRLRALCSHFLVNLLHKYNAVVPQLNKEVALQELRLVKREIEREAEETKEKLRGKGLFLEDSSRMELLEIMSHNLNMILARLALYTGHQNELRD